ncbi:MAG: hypothetical protein ACHQAY_14045 [Hyphomicrobiales bacterium]
MDVAGMTDASGNAAPDIALAARLFDELRAHTGAGEGVTRARRGHRSHALLSGA